MNTRISAVIPSAGRSSRMGTFKPLLPFDTKTLIEQAIENAAEVSFEVIVVTGYNADELTGYLTNNRGRPWLEKLRPIHNEAWQDGMFSSIQRAAEAIGGDYFFIAPADMPYLSPDIYAALATHPPQYACFPEYNGRRGHPVLVSSGIIPELLRASPGQTSSMREFLRRYPTETRPVRTNSIFVDIDTLDEYRAMRGGYDVP